MLFASPVTYIVPALYLMLLGLFPSHFAKLPFWTHGIVAAVGVIVNIVANGIMVALVAVASSAVLFILLVFLGIMTKTSTVSLSVAAACLPVLAWIAFVPGFVAAGAVSAVRLRQVGGKGYLSAATAETLAASGTLGVATGTAMIPEKPDKSRLPIPDSSTLASESAVGKAHRIKIRLPLYLGTGIALAGLLALYSGNVSV